jgi:hypothetical protein
MHVDEVRLLLHNDSLVVVDATLTAAVLGLFRFYLECWAFDGLAAARRRRARRLPLDLSTCSLTFIYKGIPDRRSRHSVLRRCTCTKDLLQEHALKNRE